MSNANNYNIELYLEKYFDEKLTQGLIPELSEFKDYFDTITEELFLDQSKKDTAIIIYNELSSLKILEQLVEIPNLEEATFQDFNQVRIKTSKITYLKKINIKKTEYQRLIKVLIIKKNISLNTKKPFCSFTIILSDVLLRLTILKTINATILTIRLMNKSGFLLEDYFSSLKFSQVLKSSIKNKKNLLIAGKTGSGKTSLLQSIIKNEISIEDQVCILEDLQEINIESKNIIHLATDKLNHPMEELISWALRLSPNRIILGEIRSKEAIGFFNILNTGHSGSMATIHANSASDAIDRISFLINFYQSEMRNDHVQVKKLIVNFIDEVIFVENKKVAEHIKIKGTSKEGALYFENLI